MIKDDKLKEIKELIQKEIKNISYQGQMTIIEFEDGQMLPLYGGIAGIEGTKQTVRSCSFCGHMASPSRPVVSLNESDEPLICSACATNAIKTFVENGVEIELDLSNLVSEEFIEKILDEKDE